MNVKIYNGQNGKGYLIIGIIEEEGGYFMYKHHEQSIKNMIDYFKKQGAIALILGGSVAKGTERADSDLDGMVILTEKDYELKEKNSKR